MALLVKYPKRATALFTWKEDETDIPISRLRVDGLKTVEMVDFAALRTRGNLTATVNDQYATTVAEHLRAGLAVIAEGNARATTYQVDLTVHPALQPGDHFTTVIDGVAKSVDILGTQLTFSPGPEFKASMTLTGVKHYEL